MNLIDHRDIEIQIVVSYNLVCWFLKGQEWGPDSGPDWGSRKGGPRFVNPPGCMTADSKTNMEAENLS